MYTETRGSYRICAIFTLYGHIFYRRTSICFKCVVARFTRHVSHIAPHVRNSTHVHACTSIVIFTIFFIYYVCITRKPLFVAESWSTRRRTRYNIIFIRYIILNYIEVISATNYVSPCCKHMVTKQNGIFFDRFRTTSIQSIPCWSLHPGLSFLKKP